MLLTKRYKENQLEQFIFGVSDKTPKGCPEDGPAKTASLRCLSLKKTTKLLKELKQLICVVFHYKIEGEQLKQLILSVFKQKATLEGIIKHDKAWDP